MNNFDNQQNQNRNQNFDFKPYSNQSKPDNEEKNPKKDNFLIIIIGGVVLILLLGAVCLVSLKQKSNEAQRQAQRASSSTVQIKKLPQDNDSSDNSSQNISADDAKSNVKSAFNFAFKIMSQVNAVSGEAMDLTQLSDSDAKTLSRLFTTSQVLQDFNDATNYSSDKDDTIYGDAGTGEKKVKHPKVGNKYSVKSTSFSINSDSGDNYVFNVTMKYQPKGFKTSSIDLVVSVSKSTGKLTNVEQKV